MIQLNTWNQNVVCVASSQAKSAVTSLRNSAEIRGRPRTLEHVENAAWLGEAGGEAQTTALCEVFANQKKNFKVTLLLLVENSV